MKFIRVLKALNENYDISLQEYIKDVQLNLPKEFPIFKEEAESIIKEFDPTASVIKVDLAGSMKNGTATEDSDIDIGIYYKGNISQDELNEKVQENANGNPIFISDKFGFLDCGFYKVD